MSSQADVDLERREAEMEAALSQPESELSGWAKPKSYCWASGVARYKPFAIQWEGAHVDTAAGGDLRPKQKMKKPTKKKTKRT
jgi:hypothetical protein